MMIDIGSHLEQADIEVKQHDNRYKLKTIYSKQVLR